MYPSFGRPLYLYNFNGYCDRLKALLRHMTEEGLSSQDRQEGTRCR